MRMAMHLVAVTGTALLLSACAVPTMVHSDPPHESPFGQTIYGYFSGDLDAALRRRLLEKHPIGSDAASLVVYLSEHKATCTTEHDVYTCQRTVWVENANAYFVTPWHYILGASSRRIECSITITVETANSNIKSLSVRHEAVVTDLD